ncbi:hypothetical protein AX774_g3361 [Zancudomyces culisetae]|uniref:Uncharacterized protein n=1 Tax=Zancudomyces culisetae TaxID=1213189 RepID=A0A1R1PQF0_ZANCU|nr:hypothetical protein AX774_g3361 [Zancudomyces culisetae]|eukprot:OMH83133.1 hypothetical protein AX774_g3361 [Zancudomyces culisetae]
MNGSSAHDNSFGAEMPSDENNGTSSSGKNRSKSNGKSREMDKGKGRCTGGSSGYNGGSGSSGRTGGDQQTQAQAQARIINGFNSHQTDWC